MTGSLEQFKRELADGARRLVLGIAGGSGSGKTTLARLVQKAIGPELCAIVAQDSYYIDQSHRFDGDGGSVNFDHPSSLDFPLLARHLQALLGGTAVEVPVYDFATHTRVKRCESCAAKPMIIVDGTLILDASDVRAQLTKSVFVSTSEKTRFARRLDRDVRERGRTPEGVHKQFHLQVKPMHDQYVEPSKQHATLIVSGETDVALSLETVFATLGR